MLLGAPTPSSPSAAPAFAFLSLLALYRSINAPIPILLLLIRSKHAGLSLHDTFLAIAGMPSDVVCEPRRGGGVSTISFPSATPLFPILLVLCLFLSRTPATRLLPAAQALPPPLLVPAFYLFFCCVLCFAKPPSARMVLFVIFEGIDM